MRKFWLVCWHEYRGHVLRKRFIFAILSLPLSMLAFVLIAFLAVRSEYNPNPIGYVDLSGQFSNVIQRTPPESGLFADPAVLPFSSVQAAGLALDTGQIQVYYVIQPDYLATGRVEMVAPRPPAAMVESTFSNFLRSNLLNSTLLNETSQPVKNRLLDGSQLKIRTPDGSRQNDPNNWFSLAIPLVCGFLFLLVINTSGGYLLQAVVDEKENRTMEIIITSLSPNQLMAGKIVGNLSVGLTQMLIWFALPLAALVVLRSGPLAGVHLNVPVLLPWLLLMTLLAAFVLVAALMAAIGAAVTESREAQPIASIFTLLIMAPYWFVISILAHPNSLLARGLSFFPLTAPIVLPLRAALTPIPIWELALDLGVLVGAAAFSVWLAGRAFRLGMLRYGKKVSLAALFKRRGAV
jgi:ABC-2 type transport system permease protein